MDSAIPFQPSEEIYNRRIVCFNEEGENYVSRRYLEAKKDYPNLFVVWRLYRGISWDPMHTMGASEIILESINCSSDKKVKDPPNPIIYGLINLFRENPPVFVKDSLENRIDKNSANAIHHLSEKSFAKYDTLALACLTYLSLAQSNNLSNDSGKIIASKEPIDLDFPGEKIFSMIKKNPVVERVIASTAEKSWDRVKVYFAAIKFYERIVDFYHGNPPLIKDDVRVTALEPYLTYPINYIVDKLKSIREKDNPFYQLMLNCQKLTKHSKQEVMTLGVMIRELFDAHESIKQMESQLK